VLITLQGSYTRAQATTPPHHAINFLIHTTMQLCRLQARAENLLTDRTVRWVARLALQSLTETCSCQPPKQAQPRLEHTRRLASTTHENEYTLYGAETWQGIHSTPSLWQHACEAVLKARKSQPFPITNMSAPCRPRQDYC
jgi:hypothetical protein